jgi:hypothetical protein
MWPLVRTRVKTDDLEWDRFPGMAVAPREEGIRGSGECAEEEGTKKIHSEPSVLYPFRFNDDTGTGLWALLPALKSAQQLQVGGPDLGQLDIGASLEQFHYCNFLYPLWPELAVRRTCPGRQGRKRVSPWRIVERTLMAFPSALADILEREAADAGLRYAPNAPAMALSSSRDPNWRKTEFSRLVWSCPGSSD